MLADAVLDLLALLSIGVPAEQAVRMVDAGIAGELLAAWREATKAVRN